MPDLNTEQHPIAKARRRRRKGVAVVCAVGATAIGIPAIAVQAHGGDTCDGGLLASLVQIGDCESGGGSDSARPAAVSQQQQQQSGGGGGGGGASSSSSSSSSSSGSSGSSSK